MVYKKDIAEYRKELGFTQEKLAELLNVSLSSIKAWENGRREPKHMDALRSLLDNYLKMKKKGKLNI